MNLLTKMLILSFASFWPTVSFSSALAGYKAKCQEIGYQSGTEKFGECVLELRRRELSETRASTKGQMIDQKAAALEQLLAESRQRMALEQQRYQEQLQAQQRAAQQQRKKEFWGAVTQFGLGMAQGGQRNSNNQRGGTFQPVKPPPTTDLACQSSCIGLGYSYGLCKSKCSY